MLRSDAFSTVTMYSSSSLLPNGGLIRSQWSRTQFVSHLTARRSGLLTLARLGGSFFFSFFSSVRWPDGSISADETAAHRRGCGLHWACIRLVQIPRHAPTRQASVLTSLYYQTYPNKTLPPSRWTEVPSILFSPVSCLRAGPQVHLYLHSPLRRCLLGHSRPCPQPPHRGHAPSHVELYHLLQA